jgi:hypothetical protein
LRDTHHSRAIFRTPLSYESSPQLALVLLFVCGVTFCVCRQVLMEEQVRPPHVHVSVIDAVQRDEKDWAGLTTSYIE